MFKCRKCGSFVNEEDLFCKNCGRKLEDEIKIIAQQEEEGFFNNEEALGKEETYGGEIEKKEDKKLRIEDIKVFAVLAVVLLILLLGSYIGKAIFQDDQSINERNMSTFAQHGRFTYFSYGSVGMSFKIVNGGFYSFAENDPVPVKFSDEVGGYIKVKGNWIYFINIKDDRGSLYKMKTDGTGKAKLSGEVAGAFDLRFTGNYIYYKDSYEGYNLCRIELDGSSKENIGDDVLGFYIQGDWIYYSTPSQLGSLYKMKLDGSDNKKVADINGSIAYINDNYIYYNEIDSEALKTYGLKQTQQYYIYSEGPLYRMRKDGTERQIIIEDKVSNVYVRGKYIYYKPSAITDNTEFYKVDLNGNHQVKLPLGGYFIGILDKWIYYEGPENYELYRTTLDFKMTQKIETDIFKPTLVEEYVK